MNTAKTKICEQETEIKELKFKNKVLEDRLASLEKQLKRNIGDQYPSSIGPDQPTCGASRWCYMPPPPPSCCAHTHSASSVDGQRLDRITEDIKSQSEQLTELTKKVEYLSRCLTSPNGLPSQHSSTPHQQTNSDGNTDSQQVDSGEQEHDTSELSIDYVMMNVSQLDKPLN